MLTLILLILKIIGIALLVLLGILLFLMLIVLFVPIRYKVNLEHGDAFILNGGVSWLLHLVHARISQSASDRRIWIRILGIIVYDSLRPPKIKRDRSESTKSAKGKVNKRNSKRNSKSNRKAHVNHSPNINEDKLNELRIDDSDKVDSIHVDKSVIDDGIKIDDIKSYDENSNDKKNDYVEHERIRHSNILTKTYQNIKKRIISIFKSIKDKLKELLEKLFNIKNKVRLILDFIKDDMNKSGFRFTFETLKKLIKHILPRRIKSKLIFGTGDPCSTGQVLGVLAILYSFYGDNLQITPDFENKVFIGSHYARGRIRIWTLLIIVIKLLLDKRFKDLKMNYQLLKEAL